MDIWQILMTPFSWLLKQFCILFDSYGIALILFTIIVKVILFPFSLKGKKGMIQMNILSAQQREIQKRFPNDRNRQQMELQKLYADNGVNPMGGCLWTLVPLLILFPLYEIVRRPLKHLMGQTEAATTSVAHALGWTDFVAAGGGSELTLASMLNPGNLAQVASTAGVTGLFVINFNFLGMNLSQIPNWKFWEGGVTWNSIGLFLLPVISAALSLASSLIMNKTNAMNKQQQENMASQNRTMLIIMPLMSLWIGFTLPAGMCVYWITNSVLSVLQEIISGKILKKDYEQAQRKIAEQAAAAKAAEKERRRLSAERKAAALAEKKSGKKNTVHDKREESGPPLDKQASRVGMRTYARGRAYDPNRYPVTPYRDPNIKQTEPEEEGLELTEEEKALLTESATTPSTPIFENSSTSKSEPVIDSNSTTQEDHNPPFVESERDSLTPPEYGAPQYGKPDYDGENKE